MNIESLREALPGRRIEYFESIDSTMRAAAMLPVGAVVVANEQTAGQGRHGHSWHSAPGSGIYVSLVLESTPLLTLALGLAAADAIAACCGLVCDLRWPNDLMLGGKKCGGILAQLVEGRAIGGIGINVNHTHFPGELAEQATSLRIASGQAGELAAGLLCEAAAPLARETLLAALVRSIDQTVWLPAGQILDRFTAASSYASGLRVVVDQPGGVVRGVTAGLDPSGFLKVRQDDGTVTLILAGGVRAARS